MELEHVFQQSSAVVAVQLLFATTFVFPGMTGRADLYRRLVTNMASYVVTFAPIGLLLYTLYKIVGLQ